MQKLHRKIYGVIAASVADIEQKEILHGVIKKAQELDIDIVVISNIYNPIETSQAFITENKVYDRILSEEIDGFILISESIINKDLQKIVLSRLEARKDVPLIVIGTPQPDFELDTFRYINSSDKDDIEELTEHLISEHGFTDIDILTGHDCIEASHKRVEGYRAALEKHGIPFNADKVFYGDFWTTSGVSQAKKYISGEIPYPQALICTNDYMAYGLLDEFLENDVEIPETMAVAGYEYIHERQSHSPLLTTYQRNRKALGEAAVDILAGGRYEDFTPPKGHLIKGESCGCGAVRSDIKSELEYLRTKETYDFVNLFSQLDQRLTESRNISEFASRFWDFRFMIRNVDKLYMCLYDNWYDEGEKYDNMVRYNLLTYEEPVIFHKNELSGLMTGKAAPYYICPLFFADRELGYVLLRYAVPDSFDHIFRNWLKSVSNGLELLRMKNDIRYLTACQNLSELHDSLTAMYNEMGIHKAFITAEKDNLYMVMLKICLFDEEFSAVNESEKVYAVLDTAEAVKQFCSKHNICARTDNNTFLCLVKGQNKEKFLTQLMSSILCQHTSYIDKYGIDSFVCTAVSCGEKSFRELIYNCSELVKKEISSLSVRRRDKLYRELSELRNYIYMNPSMTFETDKLHEMFSGSSGHLRAVYKRCFGISFHQDCINARIAKARYLLSTTTLTVQETAFECGYSDTKYFMRQFVQETGITANQFRNAVND
ncbi:MAG: substrate-binding domain-containing protein [Ruminococcus sp.]